MLTGAEIIIECLKEQDVDTVFGFPGGAVLHIYDELYKNSDTINHVLTCHEQGAAHAADGYARATGKVGVCIATSGPGATNLVTGIATAYMDSIPMVAITGNVPVSLLGKDSFQEIDIAGVTMPITKHNYIVKDLTKLADTIRDAFYIAQSGRPGPVLIDIPKDLTQKKTAFENKALKEVKRVTKDITEEGINEAVEMIKKAKRPFIFAGGGVILSDAGAELTELAHKIEAPVTCSLMAMGCFDTHDELYTGMVGMHGSKASNIGVTKSDLLIAIGVRFSDRVIGKASKFAKDAKIIHIDIDPAEINKNIPTTHHIIGDVKEVLTRLNAKVIKPDHKEWVEEIKDIKKNYPLKYGEGLTAEYVIEKLSDLTDGDAIISTEVGQHQMWAAQFYKFKYPRTFLTSGGLGTMGYGLGASIGAKVGKPNKKVINIAGDGSFRMNLNEIITAVDNELPLVVLVINNNVLGMVRQWQDIFYEKRFSHTVLSNKLDYVKLAEAFGATAYNLTKKEDTEEILQKALDAKGPVIVNCVVHEDNKVFPMVAPGAPIDDLIME